MTDNESLGSTKLLLIIFNILILQLNILLNTEHFDLIQIFLDKLPIV